MGIYAGYRFWGACESIGVDRVGGRNLTKTLNKMKNAVRKMY